MAILIDQHSTVPGWLVIAAAIYAVFGLPALIRALNPRVDAHPVGQTYRNGYREREWDTRVGTIELDIPKLRAGTYFPGLLEPRRRHERALLSVVQEAYIHGLSTRDVDALAEALGLKGISKDQVSRICKELDAQVHASRTDPSTTSTRT